MEEKLQMAEDIREILREVGVGTVEGYEEIPRAEFAAKSTIYAQVLEANVGAIDIVDYNQTAPDGTPWVILEHWNEGRLGTSNGKNYIARIRQFPFGQATKRRSMLQNIITKPRFR